MTIRISHLLTPQRINLDIQAKSKVEAILEVAEMLRSHPAMKDFTGFFDALIERDKALSTNLGNGIAFPHARCDDVSEIMIAVGRSKEGIAFDGEKAHLIFVIGTPRSTVSEYLVLVGSTVRLLKNETTRQSLINAETAEDFIAQLETT